MILTRFFISYNKNIYGMKILKYMKTSKKTQLLLFFKYMKINRDDNGVRFFFLFFGKFFFLVLIPHHSK